MDNFPLYKERKQVNFPPLWYKFFDWSLTIIPHGKKIYIEKQEKPSKINGFMHLTIP